VLVACVAGAGEPGSSPPPRLPIGCHYVYLCTWACTRNCDPAGCGPWSCNLFCDDVEQRCNFLGDNPVYTGDLPSPPGPPGQPWDANRDNKLNCWKWAVKGYDSNGTCCQQYGATDSGCNPPCGRGHVHKGQDLAAPCGTLVRAPGWGVVANFGYNNRSMGNWVEVKLANNVYVVYMHLSWIPDWVRKGASVYPGQAIGKVGNNGTSYGCHLHLQVQTVPDLPPSPADSLQNTLDPRSFFGNC
jgi:murein DD-endopeptidase MepM/ murein hydrolase activator NlpD